jgi:hypothetical protein
VILSFAALYCVGAAEVCRLVVSRFSGDRSTPYDWRDSSDIHCGEHCGGATRCNLVGHGGGDSGGQRPSWLSWDAHSVAAPRRRILCDRCTYVLGHRVAAAQIQFARTSLVCGKHRRPASTEVLVSPPAVPRTVAGEPLILLADESRAISRLEKRRSSDGIAARAPSRRRHYLHGDARPPICETCRADDSFVRRTGCEGTGGAHGPVAPDYEPQRDARNRRRRDGPRARCHHPSN